MAFDSLGRYNPQHKTWDHVGNIIPQVEHSEGIRPHGEFRPAAWLPVQFYDKFFEDWFVIMPGKILAMDNSGRVVPGQYGLSGAQITYTANDVEAGVIDVRTGSALALANIGTFDVSTVSGFMGTGEAMAVSKPVGVAPYAYWQWAGDASEFDDGFNPAGYRRHNYNLQHRTAILCDYVLELPVVPAQESTGVTISQDSRASNVAVLKGTFTNLLPVAKNTMRTEITFEDGTESDSATRFVVEKDSASAISAAGDWFMDLTTGDVHVYASGDIAGNYVVKFFHYGSAPTGSNVSKFASIVGDVKPGNFLVCNADSNFAIASTEDFKDIVGQCLEVEDVLGKDALDRVRTAFPSLSTDASGGLPGYAGQLDQMPGSASEGAPDKLHYAGAANLVARVNLVSR